MKYIVIKDYNEAPQHPITIVVGEKLKFIEESDPSGSWPNWILCKGTDKEGWIPKQILKIDDSVVTALEDYIAKEHTLKKVRYLFLIKNSMGGYGVVKTQPQRFLVGLR